VRPDYHGGSIVNLMASIVTAFGGRSEYETARDLAPAEIASARNVVLLVLDGLGYRHLSRALAGGALHRATRASLTSTFPSTTAAAITTFMTGLAPQGHGLTGWHMYFREIGAVLAVLPFRPRHGGPSLAASGVVTPAELLGHAPIVDELQAATFVVSPAAIVESDFNRAVSGGARRVGYGELDAMFAAVRDIVRGGTGRQYVYAYYSELDALAHAHGVASAEVSAELARVDAAFARFLDAIAGTDTLVLATADHGFVDTRPGTVVELHDHPELAAMLALPLCGEPRVAYCYVRPGEGPRFERYVESRLGHCASLRASADLLAEGWFGPGVPHARLAERIGDYVLVMKDGYAIRDELPGERRHVQIGVHGGTSADEMLVPLVVARP
jgi:predicted AlkP superfamily pyrophosphatase or phosphodiesterase